MGKYDIINLLNKGKMTAEEIAKEINMNINSVRVILARLKKTGEIIVVGNNNRELIYISSDKPLLQNEYEKGFNELFSFFIDVMKNPNIISDKTIWNQLLSKRDLAIIDKLGGNKK